MYMKLPVCPVAAGTLTNKELKPQPELHLHGRSLQRQTNHEAAARLHV